MKQRVLYGLPTHTDTATMTDNLFLTDSIFNYIFLLTTYIATCIIKQLYCIIWYYTVLRWSTTDSAVGRLNNLSNLDIVAPVKTTTYTAYV